MSIVQLKKITLFGLLTEKQDILAGLQGLGCMHLSPLSPPPAEVEKVASLHAETAYKALRFLSAVPQQRRQVRRDAGFDADKLVQEVLELKQRLRDAGDRRDFLKRRINDLEPWGNVAFPPHETLAGYRLWFYILPLRKRGALDDIELPWRIAHRDQRFAYVVIIAKQEPPGDLLPVPRTHVGALPLSELQAQLEEVEVELEDLAAQRQGLTRYIYLLSVNLAGLDNRAALVHAAQLTRDEGAILAVQGWVPVNAIAAVKAYAEKMELACLVEEPGPDETPPTLIEQPDRMDAGVDLTLFYQVPSYRSWDPTLLLFASFSVFFAMILADAGYGLTLMAGLLAFWKKLGRSRKGRAYRLLGASLFTCTVGYGVMVGSYFGITPPDDSFLGQLHIISVNDFDTMMKLSVIIGVLHIGLANAMMAFVNRSRLIALSKLGWIAAIVGGLLLWLTSPESVWRTVSIAFMVTGLLAIVLFSSDRPVSKASDYLRRWLDGVFSLKAVLTAFGDVLSYMRLFALGLASASLAITFNDLANDVYQSVPGLGLLASLLVLAVGHVLNLGLSLMSGVVHGLRLNFIEFFNWGLAEEGTSFQKFARKEVNRE